MPNWDQTAWENEREIALAVERITEMREVPYGPAMDQPLTACNQCAHYKSAGTLAWEQICLASPRFHFDARKGVRYQNGFESIHAINDGSCSKFTLKAKETNGAT